MPDKVFEAILGSLQRQIDRNWQLRWDPKTVAEEIKAALHEVSPAEFRSAVQQPGPMFVQYGQPGLIGESEKDVHRQVNELIEKLLELVNQMEPELDASEKTTIGDGLRKVRSGFRM